MRIAGMVVLHTYIVTDFFALRLIVHSLTTTEYWTGMKQRNSQIPGLLDLTEAPKTKLRFGQFTSPAKLEIASYEASIA